MRTPSSSFRRSLCRDNGCLVLSKCYLALNPIMVEGYDAPFRSTCTQAYKSIMGQRVNLIRYPGSETVGGVEYEVMNAGRIKIA